MKYLHKFSIFDGAQLEPFLKQKIKPIKEKTISLLTYYFFNFLYDSNQIQTN